MKLIFIIVVCFIFFGCAGAEIISTHALPTGGVVRYNNGQLVHDKSRLIALDKMADFCKGKNYKIIKEEFNPNVLSFKVADTYYSGKDNYMFIDFLCE